MTCRCDFFHARTALNSSFCFVLSTRTGNHIRTLLSNAKNQYIIVDMQIQQLWTNFGSMTIGDVAALVAVIAVPIGLLKIIWNQGRAAQRRDQDNETLKEIKNSVTDMQKSVIELKVEMRRTQEDVHQIKDVLYGRKDVVSAQINI